MTILACSAADSDVFFNYLSNLPKTNDTVQFVLSMIGNKGGHKINFNRVLLLSKHFPKQQKFLITDIKVIDLMNTVSFMAQTLLKNVSTYVRTSKCMNKWCLNPCYENPYAIISINSFFNEISLQDDIDEFFKSSTVNCIEDNCISKRAVTINAMSHLLIELTFISKGKKMIR